MSSVNEVHTRDVVYVIDKCWEEEDEPPTVEDMCPFFGLGRSVMERELKKISKNTDKVYSTNVDGNKYWVVDRIADEDYRYLRCSDITDDILIDAIETLYEAGENDAGKGGIYIEKLSDHFAVSRHFLENKLEDMEEEGKVKEVQGMAGSCSPRASWLTIDIYEDTHDEREKLSYLKYQD